MATALVYLVVLLVVAALFFVLAAAVFGRGEELAPIPPGSSPTWLPDDSVGPGDVRALRFQQAVRGYRMAEVDWVLDRLAEELERVTADREELRGRLADLEAPGGSEARVAEGADRPVGEPAGASVGPSTAESSAESSEEPERA